jgi:glycosyltransferase involved in cell wall biosynthesis
VRIMAFAYACEPHKGSEPGAGWAWSRMLARLGETWVITRANNREAIEAQVAGIPEGQRLHFVYVDLPSWARRWKRGQRGIHLYYLLWQAMARHRARSLDRVVRFDLAWHLTLANAWLGTTAPLVGRPFVYGPVGGGAKTPFLLLPILGLRGISYEALRNLAQALGRYLNPLARTGWRRATVILVQNRETLAWLPKRYRHKGEVFPNAVFEEPTSSSRRLERRPTRTAMFAARLLPWKGAELAIRTIEILSGWRLVIIGSGPDEPRLRRTVRKRGLAARVQFVPTVPREDLLRRMQESADVFLFPSLHDDGPWVVAEAASCGLPVVCLDVGGPPVLGGKTVTPSTPARTAHALAKVVVEAAAARPDGSAMFTLASREVALRHVLTSKGLLPAAPPGGQALGENHDVGTRQ